MSASPSSAFENVRDQIGYCGIWCGSCAVGNGSLRAVTERYRGTIEGHGIEHWAPKDLNYQALAEGLTIIQRIATCPGCRQGGGREGCEIRACARESAHNDCLACAERSQCPHTDLLTDMRSGARAAGLIVKNEHDDDTTIIRSGEGQLRFRWPASVLFL